MTQPASLTCSISNTSLGKILVASSPQGICALYIGEQTDALLQTLSDDFPLADTLLTRLSEVPGHAADWHQAALDIAIGLRTDAPPLHLHGTGFQQAVWNYLQSTPPGTVISPDELAAATGLPDAGRAAAKACHGNKIAVLIPCHRVQGTDETLGYRWGEALQQLLLEREKTLWNAGH